MAVQRRYKAVNFDLDTAALRKRFGESRRRSAYRLIQRYMENNGFEHRQGSGYRSIKTFSEAEIIDLIVAMYGEFDWLSECVQRLDVTNIGREYDIDSIARARLADASNDEPFDVGL